MSWAKKDDNFYDSPEIIEAELSWSEMGMLDYMRNYCARHLTDGLVPRVKVIKYLSKGQEQDPAKAVANSQQTLNRLLELCLVAERPDGKLEVCRYLEANDSKAQVEEKRASLSEVRAASGRKGAEVTNAKRFAERLPSKESANGSANGQQRTSAKLGPASRPSPILTDPHHTDPGEPALIAGSPPDIPDAPTRAHTTAAAPTPEPGPGAPAPATPPVRLVNFQEKIPLNLIGFHADIAADLKAKGAPGEPRRAAAIMHRMLFFVANVADNPSSVDDVNDSAMNEYSFAVRTLEKFELLSREDAQQAKRILGSLLAMLVENNKQRGIG